MSKQVFTCSISEFRDHVDSYEGICLSCGEWTDSVEPDAEGYECAYCGEFKVMGAEYALLMGHVEFDGE